MVGQAKAKPNHNINEQPLPLPLLKTPSAIRNPQTPSKPVRHVSFAPLPPSLPKTIKKKKRRHPPCTCSRCCSWTCIVILATFCILAFIGACFLGYYQPILPEFKIKKINVLSFNTTTEIDTLLETVNRNHIVTFSYNVLSFHVSSDTLTLGQTTVPAFFVGTKNLKLIDVHTKAYNALVANPDKAKVLQERYARKQMALDLLLRGSMNFRFGKWPWHFPLTVICRNVSVLEGDTENNHECNVKLFFLESLP